MPVYNGEKYIEAALDSILSQTFTNFELIISDNASTDRTAEICKSYTAKDKRIQFFRSEKNLGASPNFNRVFKLSSGEYFKWAAHDDILAPEFLSRCVDVLNQNPTTVLCYPKARIIDENGKFLGVHTFKADINSPKPQIRFRNLVLNPDTAFQVFGLMRANIARKTRLIGNYPASDLVLLAELVLYGDFIEIPEPLFFPRYHPDQSIKGQWRVERDRVLWFDTSLEGRILLPKWLYLLAYLQSINRSPVKRYEKIFCYAQMVRWVFIPSHIRALGKDLYLAAKKLFMRTFSKNKTSTA